MAGFDSYSDDDLQRLMQKMQGVQGGKDRLEAITAVLNARGIAGQDGRQEALNALLQPSTDDYGNDAQEG